MSKQDKFDFEIDIKLKNQPTELMVKSIEKTLKNNDRVQTKLKAKKDEIDINILAKDINVIRSVINMILLSIKTLSEVNKYE